jgi:hypothetical protein
MRAALSSDLDPEAAAIIGPHLLVREELLWCGRPHDVRALWSRALVILGAAAAALALRLPQVESALGFRPQAQSIVLAGMVLLLIAEAFVFHLYLSRTYYGVTPFRVIIVAGLRELHLTEVFIDQLNSPHLRIVRHPTSVEFLGGSNPESHRRISFPFSNPSASNMSDGREHYRLLGIQDAGKVYRLILDCADKLERGVRR